MATKTRRRRRRNRPAVAVDVRRATRSGATIPLGPRAVLSLAEAAKVLKRPVSEVRASIRTGFLRPTRRNGRVVGVTVGACQQFLAEEREDGRASVAALERARRTGDWGMPLDEFLRSRGRG